MAGNAYFNDIHHTQHQMGKLKAYKDSNANRKMVKQPVVQFRLGESDCWESLVVLQGAKDQFNNLEPFLNMVLEDVDIARDRHKFVNAFKVMSCCIAQGVIEHSCLEILLP